MTEERINAAEMYRRLEERGLPVRNDLSRKAINDILVAEGLATTVTRANTWPMLQMQPDVVEKVAAYLEAKRDSPLEYAAHSMATWKMIHNLVLRG